MIDYRNYISVKDYLELRMAVGWQPLREKHAKAGLDGAAYTTVAYDDEVAAGMARVISDGGYMALIVDVMVKPEYQGRGIGKALVANAIDYLKSSVEDEDLLMINLMSVKGKEGFYKKLGFVERPNEVDGSGFAIWLNK